MSKPVSIIIAVMLSLAGSLFAVQNPFCGINIHGYDGYSQNVVLNEESAQMFEDMGIKWIRLEFINDYTSSPKGVMHYDVYDKMIKTAKDHNLNILGLVTYQTYPWNEKSDWNDAAWQAKWLERVKEIVNRYKNQVSAWEIWNEPNIPEYALCTYDSQDNVDLTSYAKLLCNSYDAIKAITPDSKVIMGGLAIAGEDHNTKPGHGDPFADDHNFFYELYNNQYFKDYVDKTGYYPFDYIAFHPYNMWGPTEGQDPENYLMKKDFIGKAVRVLKSVGDTKTKFWLTELGWNSCPTPDNSINKSGTEEQNINTLGDFIYKMFDVCRNTGEYADRIDKVFYFQYQDWADQHFGILNESGQNKQAAIDAFKKWTDDNPIKLKNVVNKI